ncbi:PIN domain-containing protein [Candidatus Micrarchaeota archaeon]|nr:PIN domain-containing protein [Candidatus Micrarchaeota archaeon]
MTEILVDTSVIISYLKGNTTESTDRILASNENVISLITYFEVLKFLYKTRQGHELEFFKQKIQQYDTRPLNPKICETAAKLVHTHGLCTADALIYATAIENGIGLITSDTDLKGKPGVIYAKPK